MTTTIPARDWELTCHECDGSGHVYVKHQVAERQSDVQEFKEECDCCEGRGFVFAFQDIPGIEEYVKTCRPAPAGPGVSTVEDAQAVAWMEPGIDVPVTNEYRNKTPLRQAKYCVPLYKHAPVNAPAAGVSRVEQDERSATHGMTLGERIAHVGGRTNAQGYIEFGSPMAVDALIQHVLRDIDCTRQEDDGAYQARYRLPGGQWSSWGHVVCGVKGHEQELRYLPGERRPAPAAGDALDAARYRQLRKALTSYDTGWLDRIAAALEAMGLDPDEDKLPTPEQVDGAFDAACRQAAKNTPILADLYTAQALSGDMAARYLRTIIEKHGRTAEVNPSGQGAGR